MTIQFTREQERAIAAHFGGNRPNVPADPLRLHNEGLRLWAELETAIKFKVYEGYWTEHGYTYRRQHDLTKTEFLDAWDNESYRQTIQFPNRALLTGHTYRIYIDYHCPIQGGTEFQNIIIWDAESLSAPPYSRLMKIGEVAL